MIRSPRSLSVLFFLGKAVTFDTGGLCLKNCKGMSEYRADLAGAAVTLAAIKCAAQMALPINIRGENRR